MVRYRLILLGAVAASFAQLLISPSSAEVTGLSPKCQALYQNFIDWNSYYKVFAYGESGAQSVCAYREGKQDALDACTTDLGIDGFECLPYAVSPVNGQVKIVWDQSLTIQSKPHLDQALVQLSNKSICSLATTYADQKLLWDESAPWNVREAKRRGLSLRICWNAVKNMLSPVIVTAAASDDKATQAQFSATTPLDEYEYVDQCRNNPTLTVWDQRRGESMLCDRYLASRPSRAVKPERVAAKPARVAAEPVNLSPLRRKHRDAIAVIIGNKNYKGRIHAVDFAHNDADAMKRFVLDRLGYREGNIIDLRDASQAPMLAVFGNDQTHEGKLYNWVKAGKSDVLVFYSGHGVPGLRDRRAYLLPVDSDADHAEITGIPIDTLFANLAKIPAKSVTVYLDACFSGESPKGMIIRATSGISVTPKMPTTSGGMTVITAARGDQLASWDETAKHGLFTKHLLDALYGAADGEDYGNGDGAVSVTEVQTYLEDEMTYQARRTWGRRQNASVRGRGDTALVYLTAKAISAAAVAVRPKAVVAKPRITTVRPAIEKIQAIYTVLKTANLRAGPSTRDEIVGRLAAATRVIVSGRVRGTNWYRLDDGSFIFGSLIRADN